MKRGNGVFKGFIFLGIIMISVGLVSAGWFNDLFSLGDDDGDLEGELASENFDASVSLTNTAPVILTPIPNIVDVDNPDVPPIPNEVNPITSSVNNAEINFTIQDDNGEGNLPGGDEVISLASSVGEVVAGTANLEVYVTSPDFGLITLATSCVEVLGCPDCPDGITINRKEYKCVIPMQYYFESGNTWLITIAVADTSDDTDSDSSKNFIYDSLAAFEITKPVGGLTWLGTKTDTTNQPPSNNPVGLTNRGNLDYISGAVIGNDLVPGGTGTGDNLPVDAFSVGLTSGGSPPAECNVGVTADALVNTISEFIDVSGAPNLIFGDGSGNAPVTDAEELYFCLWDQLNQHTPAVTLSESSYSSTWDLELSV